MFARGGITNFIKPGQQAFTTVGTTSFVVPATVTELSAVLVAGGGAGGYGSTCGGGNGGNLRYKNKIRVSPGETLTVVVGAGGVCWAGPTDPHNLGDVTQLMRGATVIFDTNTAIGSGADGGGNGGTGAPLVTKNGAYGTAYFGGGGGGAGGYSGNGGNGGTATSTATSNGGAGSGGGGGGGAANPQAPTDVVSSPSFSAGYPAVGGGGVGLLGQGSNGAGGSGSAYPPTGGGGGSGGATAPTGSTSIQSPNPGGNYGGGGGGGDAVGGGAGSAYPGGAGGQGAARLIWGAGRAFPSTLTGDM